MEGTFKHMVGQVKLLLITVEVWSMFKYLVVIITTDKLKQKLTQIGSNKVLKVFLNLQELGRVEDRKLELMVARKWFLKIKRKFRTNRIQL